MKVEATIINPAYKKAVDQLEYDLRHYLYYDPRATLTNRLREIEKKHNKFITIRGDMISQDFDNFTCVVLVEDGTYQKLSLDQVKVIKDDSENN